MILLKVLKKLFLSVFHLRNGNRRRAEAGLRERVGEKEKWMEVRGATRGEKVPRRVKGLRND